MFTQTLSVYLSSIIVTFKFFTFSFLPCLLGNGQRKSVKFNLYNEQMK